MWGFRNETENYTRAVQTNLIWIVRYGLILGAVSNQFFKGIWNLGTLGSIGHSLVVIGDTTFVGETFPAVLFSLSVQLSPMHGFPARSWDIFEKCRNFSWGTRKPCIEDNCQLSEMIEEIMQMIRLPNKCSGLEFYTFGPKIKDQIIASKLPSD